MERTKKFLGKNYMNIIFLIVIFILVYRVYFTPNTVSTMNDADKSKIDSLTNLVVEIKKQQDTIESNIQNVNNEIETIDENISKIKKDRNKIRKKYNEEITRIDSYTEPELDSFFSNRYH
jgi:septal ring factor EnvC (AmiA/AmiB activator)